MQSHLGSEGDNRDTTIAKALLGMFEKALAVHVADRDQLLKELADTHL